MIEFINASAKACNIQTVITNSDQGIETQLNNLTQTENLPIMLISWDIDVNLSFDENGFLNTPSIPITALLMTKSPTLEKIDMESDAFKMGKFYTQFIQHLFGVLTPLQKGTDPAITDATYKLLPKYGMGKHSGVMCKWTMRIPFEINC